MREIRQFRRDPWPPLSLLKMFTKDRVQSTRRRAREIRHSRITCFLREGMFAIVSLFITQAYSSGEHSVKRESIGTLEAASCARRTMTSHGTMWETWAWRRLPVREEAEERK